MLRLGKWGKSGPKRLLTSAVRCSGSQTTALSIVSPTAATSSIRSPSRLEPQALLEGDVGDGLGLAHGHARVLLGDAAGVGA